MDGVQGRINGRVNALSFSGAVAVLDGRNEIKPRVNKIQRMPILHKMQIHPGIFSVCWETASNGDEFGHPKLPILLLGTTSSINVTKNEVVFIN